MKSPSAAERFRASMNVTYEMWHDGVGYDLKALAQVPAEEMAPIMALLIRHTPRDWRDVEALAHIDSPVARAVVVAELGSTDPAIRRVAREYAADKDSDQRRTQLLVQSLERDDFTGGLSAAIDEAAEFHPPEVIDALFRGTLNRPQPAVLFAGLLMYLHGKAAEPFDWAQRPLFLRFNTLDRAERDAAFGELCEKLGVDPRKYLG